MLNDSDILSHRQPLGSGGPSDRVIPLADQQLRNAVRRNVAVTVVGPVNAEGLDVYLELSPDGEDWELAKRLHLCSFDTAQLARSKNKHSAKLPRANGFLRLFYAVKGSPATSGFVNAFLNDVIDDPFNAWGAA